MVVLRLPVGILETTVTMLVMKMMKMMRMMATTKAMMMIMAMIIMIISRLQDFIFVLRGKENLLAVTRMTNTNIHIGQDTEARHTLPPPPHPPTPPHTHASMYHARIPL